MSRAIFLVGLLVSAIYLSGCIVPPTLCGNGVCERGETHDNCPHDCPLLGYDLAVIDMNISPEKPKVGDILEIQVTIKNLGVPTSFSGQVDIVYSNGIGQISQAIPGSPDDQLATNEIRVITFTSGRLGIEGDTTITATFRPFGEDVNWANNQKTKIVYVAPALVENRPPVIESSFPLDKIVTLSERETQLFSITASDPDGDELIITWFLNGNNVGDGNQFILNSNGLKSGEHDLNVIASDGKLSADHYWLVIIENVCTGVDDNTYISDANCWCQNGICVNNCIDCDDRNQCTLDDCTYGLCQHVSWREGQQCGPNSVCQNGVCINLCADMNCDDRNPCTIDSCNFGECQYSNQLDGTNCGMGLWCQNGACLSCDDLNWDDNNPCTIDSCDENTGIIHTNVADGTSCGTDKSCWDGICYPTGNYFPVDGTFEDGFVWMKSAGVGTCQIDNNNAFEGNYAMNCTGGDYELKNIENTVLGPWGHYYYYGLLVKPNTTYEFETKFKVINQAVSRCTYVRIGFIMYTSDWEYVVGHFTPDHYASSDWQTLSTTFTTQPNVTISRFHITIGHIYTCSSGEIIFDNMSLRG